MNTLKKRGLVISLIAVMIFGSVTTVMATSSPTTPAPGNTDIIDSEDVDKVNDPNTEENSEEGETDSELGEEENDKLNSANNDNKGSSDGETTFIDRVRDILPKTGDTTNVMLWVLIMFACIAGAVILVRKVLKNRPDKK
jgi:LPXTG-motif cell wall-anchored protein